MTVETGEGWTMYLGDCLAILPTLDQVDHVITDPPYELEAHTKSRRALVDATQKRGAVNTGRVRRIDQPLVISFGQMSEATREAAASQFARLARRWVIAFCQIEAVGTWKTVYVAAGLEWVRGSIWEKPSGFFLQGWIGWGSMCCAQAMTEKDAGKVLARLRKAGSGEFARVVPLGPCLAACCKSDNESTVAA